MKDNNFIRKMPKEQNFTNDKNFQRKKLRDNLDEVTKAKIWIRTLLYSYRIFPRIIDSIDKIIVKRASSYSFSIDVFNLSKNPEYQYNTVIDLSERKKKILNIYIMVKNLLSNLSKEKYELAINKFYEQMTNDELAVEYGVSTRTIFRRINDVINSLYNFMVKNNWSVKFIELQVKDEMWLTEKYNYAVNEYITNSVK